MTTMDFGALPDLAGRALGGAVVAASDEFFAEKENLLTPQAPEFRPHTFGHKGQVYDGWETRRRRDAGHDWAVVRLGAPGVIHGITVDTAFFTGNYPEQCSVEATSVSGYPSPEELGDDSVEWVEIVPKEALKGDSNNLFAVTCDQRFTHVRLNIFPDGGVARLRVHGEVLADPRSFAGMPLDLAAQENGGVVTGCSNRFFSSPNNLLMPGHARVMGEGWETARRRDDGNDWVEVRLAAEGIVHQVEVDTTHFKGNAPGWFRLTGTARSDARPHEVELLPRTRLQPDTRHRFPVTASEPVDHVRVDVYPDGGFARLRVYGDLTPSGRAHVGLGWFNRLQHDRADALLSEEGGLPARATRAILDDRPYTDLEALRTAAHRAGADPTSVEDLVLGT